MLSIAPNLLTTQRLILRQWRESDRPAFARLNADPVVREFFPRCLSRDESDADAARIQKTIEERGWGFWAVEVKSGDATAASQRGVTAAGESDITAHGASVAVAGESDDARRVFNVTTPCITTAPGASALTTSGRSASARGESGVAASAPPGAPFIGFVGLWVPGFTAHFTSPIAKSRRRRFLPACERRDFRALPCVEIGWRLSKEHWGNGYASEAAIACLRFGFEKLTLQQIVAFTAPLNKRSTAVMERIGMSRDPADDFDHPNIPPGNPLRRHVLYRMSRADWEHLYVPRDAQLT